MANRQTKELKKLGLSLRMNKGIPVENQNKDHNHFTIIEVEKPPCQSKRKSLWKGNKSSRDGVIYPAEFKHRAPKN